MYRVPVNENVTVDYRV